MDRLMDPMDESSCRRGRDEAGLIVSERELRLNARMLLRGLFQTQPRLQYSTELAPQL
jgi:hypothetical protein